MLSGYIFTSALFALLFIILGLLVFLRNTKQLVNRQFLTFTIFAAGWLVTNYLGGTSSLSYKVAAPANHLVLAFGSAMAAALLAFVINFSGSKSRLTWPIIVVNGVAVALCATPLIVDSVTRQATTYTINFGPLGAFYFATLAADLVLMLIILVRSFRRSKGALRDQLGTILLSFAVSFTGILVTNALFPVAFNYYGLTNAGSLFSAILVIGIAYTIIRHKLFDVRLVVARSLAYILSVGVLGVGYSLLSLTLVSHFIKSDGKAINIAVNTILIVFAAATFTPLKKFFDKTTNRFFYQDAYDSQAFLDKFNKNLVASYDLNALLRKSAEIIEETIKPDYVVLGIKETDNTARRIIGTPNHPTFSEKDIAFVRGLTPRMKLKMIVTDSLGEEYQGLRGVLQANSIAMLARLAATNKEEGLGYLLLGPKKSGNSFSAQDINTIEIIANELVIAVQNALRTEEIENFNITLQGKVEEATHKLRRTNEKLKALDETKDDFISMASHQLRTPLTSVKGYISMVLEEDAGKINHMQREMLGQAFFSSQRMVYLIADLLNVSRLKTGKFIIEPAKVNLADVIEQELQQLEETAAARQLTLQFDKPANFPDIMLDETKTRQVIMNFVDNAIYYTPAGGHIKVELSDAGGAVTMRVSDDGIGVPKHEQPHLFTKFYRAGNARQARPDGTGLGLFMAKKVIMAQGGSLLFESTEGKGSTFGFVFGKGNLGAAQGVVDAKPMTAPTANKPASIAKK